MEPLVIDLAKEEVKMAKIVRNIHAYCLSRLYDNILARSIAPKEN